MHIRNAQIDELDRIMEIYAHARAFMAETGNPKQWGATNWPPRELIVQDIAQGKCYVCCVGAVGSDSHAERIVGVFYYDFGDDIDDTYRNIENGAWQSDAPYGVVHRIASDGSVKGVGTFCIGWAFAQCGYLRIDTHGDNLVMQHLLAKLGFVQCGVIYVEEDNDPRLAYEKMA